MMVLVIGGSGSGKSEFAEREACVLGGEYGGRKYYVAAMRVFDEEGQRKVERHRRMRMGKGFDTIEQFTDIFLAAERMGERPRTVHGWGCCGEGGKGYGDAFGEDGPSGCGQRQCV